MNIPKAKSALTPKSELPWSSKDAMVRLIMYYGLILVFMLTFQLGFANIVSIISNNTIDSLIIQAAVIGLVGFLLTYIFLSFDDKKIASVGFKSHKKLFLFIIIAFFTTVISLSVAYIIEIAGEVVSIDQMLSTRYMIESDFNDLLSFLIITLLTFFGIALGEEIMFRGYIQNVLESQTSYLRATAISSILFGLLHSFLLTAGNEQVLQSMIAIGLSATIFGFVFSYAYKISGNNLTLPILIHATWNSIIFFFNTDFDYATISKILFEIFSQLVAAIILIGLLMVIKGNLKLSDNN
jgi:hypothetical protein